MSILYLLIPISILIVLLTGVIFWWALNSRQFDNLDDVSKRVLEDTETPADKTLAN